MAPSASTQERKAGDQKYSMSIGAPLHFAGHTAGQRKAQQGIAVNFAIDESNLEARREFIRVGENERQLLASR